MRSRSRISISLCEVWMLIEIPDRLLRSVPGELRSVVNSHTTALIHLNGGEASWYAIDNERSAIVLEPEMPQWRDEIRQLLSGRPEPFVVSSLDQEARFPDIVRFFRMQGNESLCILPLRKAHGRLLGAMCFARRESESFAESEVSILSFIADYVSLAIDDRLNLAQSEAVRVQLESEQTRLNSFLISTIALFSNLELGDVLKFPFHQIFARLCDWRVWRCFSRMRRASIFNSLRWISRMIRLDGDRIYRLPSKPPFAGK